jgi:hypothetical protein
MKRYSLRGVVEWLVRGWVIRHDQDLDWRGLGRFRHLSPWRPRIGELVGGIDRTQHLPLEGILEIASACTRHSSIAGAASPLS